MSTTELAGIGLKAIEYKAAVDTRMSAAKEFGAACDKWKRRNRVGFIDRNSALWFQMMDALDDDLDVVKKAKAAERNARERLFRAVRRAT